MGDKRRFSAFAELIREHIPQQSRLVDVAGGKGYMQAALRALGFDNILTFDKRRRLAKPHRQHMYRYAWFSYNQKEDFDAVIAMHPDQGTDHAILYAVKRDVPFLVCPCCVLPSASCYWGSRSNYAKWLDHLESLAIATHVIERVTLPIDGRAVVLVGRPIREARITTISKDA